MKLSVIAEVPKKKRGRPTTVEGRKRDTMIQIRISESEHSYLKQIIETQGISASDYFRRYLEQTISTFDNPELPTVKDPNKEYISIKIEGIVREFEKQEAKALLKQLTEKLLN